MFMKFKRVAVYALALTMMVVSVVGCATSGANTQDQACVFTKRQQLACLKRVWKAGVIDKDAYEREWARIVDAN